MSPGTIAVLASVTALIGLALWGMLRSRKKGTCCCTNCKGCPHASACHTLDRKG